MTTIQRTHKATQSSRGGLMWLLYLADAGLLVTSGQSWPGDRNA